MFRVKRDKVPCPQGATWILVLYTCTVVHMLHSVMLYSYPKNFVWFCTQFYPPPKKKKFFFEQILWNRRFCKMNIKHLLLEFKKTLFLENRHLLTPYRDCRKSRSRFKVNLEEIVISFPLPAIHLWWRESKEETCLVMPKCTAFCQPILTVQDFCEQLPVISQALLC